MSLELGRRYSNSSAERSATLSRDTVKFRVEMGFEDPSQKDDTAHEQLKREIVEGYGAIERNPNPSYDAVLALLAKKDKLLDIDRSKMSDPFNLSGRVSVHPFGNKK